VYHGWAAVDNTIYPNLNGWRADWHNPNGVQDNSARTVVRCPYGDREEGRNGQGLTVTVTLMLAGYRMDDPNDNLLRGDNRAGIHEF
jgi:hypothetical protein